jgi:lipopolysaccharide biosynthesis glycosyltransferase
MRGFSVEKVAKWAKAFIHEYLPHYSKVVYLDSDVMVKCDIAELWNTDLKDKVVAGATDMAAHYLGSKKEKLMKDVFHCDTLDDYINLGVMIMNLDSLRQMNFTQKFLRLIASVPGNLWNLYDIFNSVLFKNINILPMAYNFQNSLLIKSDDLYSFFEDKYYFDFQKTKYDGPKIVHFSGIQPWYKMIGVESANWWNMVKKTNFYEMILLSMFEDLKKN